MKDLTPRKEELESIEIASLDEIQDLQLRRLKWSVSHAYDNIEFYKRKYDRVRINIFLNTNHICFNGMVFFK